MLVWAVELQLLMGTHEYENGIAETLRERSRLSHVTKPGTG